jgi:hypothetical protein
MGISPPDHNEASDDNIDGESERYRENMRVEDTFDVSAYPLQHADSTNNDPLLQGPIHELIYGDYQDEVFDWVRTPGPRGGTSCRDSMIIG